MNHFIDGEWLKGSGTPFESVNPATNAIIWSGQIATAAETNLAVSAAKKAFTLWRSKSIDERFEILSRFGTLLTEKARSMAITISQETGKPLWESHSEVQSMINKIDLSRKAYEQRTGLTKTSQTDATSITLHRPHGVMVVLGPFNFPGHLPNGHIIPALLAGNTIVFKPSHYTPLVAIETLKLWEAAGIPQGVINLVQGNAQTGQLLISHPDSNGICFTGSYATGLAINRQLVNHPEKIVALEMGGNNPLLVFDINDTKAAAYLTIQSAFISAGQRCTCARRLIIPDSPDMNDYLQHLIQMTQQCHTGFYTDIPEPFMGSVISTEVATSILDIQEKWMQQGAISLLKSAWLKPNTGLLTPGIIDVSSIPKREDIEIFGPLLQVIRVPNFAAALVEANNTAYGLAAGLFSDNPVLFSNFYDNVKAGIINWNRPLTGASSAAPFGGIGHSGNHRPSAWYAADYCAYPVASVQSENLNMPTTILPGMYV